MARFRWLGSGQNDAVERSDDDRFARDEEEAAAIEAAAIGGRSGDRDVDEADRPLVEAGEGEAEGFEVAEEDLVEHASHGDEHSARIPYYDAEDVEEDERA